MTAEAKALRAEAAQHHQDAADSFDRCDTDGFLTQWASGITGQLKTAQARILEAGGTARFLALLDLDGNIVGAKRIDGKYGECWALLDGCDWDSLMTGDFVGFAKRQATYEKKGYRVGIVIAPASASIKGSGTGLAGAASCYVGVDQRGSGKRVVHDGTGIDRVHDLYEELNR